MPIFYNTSSPTPTTKNTINDVAVTYGIRDFLLNLNLPPQYPFISTSINGSPMIGQPVLDTMVGSGALSIPIGLPLDVNGLLFKDLNVIYNTFQNDPSISNNLEDINYIPAIQNPDYVGAIWPSDSFYPTGANPDVEQYGIKGKTIVAGYREDNVTKNLYLDSANQIDMADYIGLYPLDITQQLTNYYDVFGGISLGFEGENIIGSLLNGQGIGLGPGSSVIPNFDFRASLVGRVLGASGFIKDTKLGNIGAQQLSLALANNAAFNVQQEILGALNVQENIISLIQDGNLADFPRPNYKITIPKSTGGQILNGVTQILGFTIPRSYLDDDGSIFQNENGDAANIDRANSMILNTGKGQVAAMVSNMIANLSVNSVDTNPFRSGYAPAFNNNKGNEAISVANARIYSYEFMGKVEKLLGNTGDIIPEINYNREAMTKNSGFESPDETGTGTFIIPNSGYDNRKISTVGFSWTSQEGEALNKITNTLNLGDIGNFEQKTNLTGDKKSLLVKTQKLFNSKGMKNLVSVKGEMNLNSSQIQTANNNGVSKGSAVLTANMYDLEIGRVSSTSDNPQNVFCRSWTTLDRYDSVSNLIRKKALHKDPEAPYRYQTDGSVLDGPFVKIAPYTDDSPTDPKKFMFSIENLAWAGDAVSTLPKCEQGPGDLTTGKRGRIMWFPPYDLSFSENNAVNWEETNFIGRGEPIMTYNNTKRGGQLSFKIIVDHPSYYNAFRGENGPDDNYIASFFAGCVPMDKRWADKLSTMEISAIEKPDDITLPPSKVALDDPCQPDITSIFYPNDNVEYNIAYENGYCGLTPIDYDSNKTGQGCGLGLYQSDVTQADVNGTTREWPDRFNYGLNAGREGKELKQNQIDGVNYNGFFDDNYQNAMIKFLNDYKWAVVTVQGYASPQGNPSSNIKLADRRGQIILDNLKTSWGTALGLTEEMINKRFKLLPGKPLSESDVVGCVAQTPSNPNPPTDTLGCKKGRRVDVGINFDKNLKAETEKALQPEPKVIKRTRTLTTEVKNKLYTECSYFDRLTENDPFVFDSIRQKIRYFHPAFHSTTPEGLNSRLTFLLQCTRQGKTLEEQGASNLAFGRAPICILRLGDFYNTKIAIDNINIDYEPLVWDLNPEGVGVQPMIANVDMTFTFLGGSSLMGPLNKLQNALSFNYFANTQVYDSRADYLTKAPPKAKSDPSQVINENIPTDVGETLNEDTISVPKKFAFGKYVIVDGQLQYNGNETITEQLVYLNGLETNQVSADEQVNSGLENSNQPYTGATSGSTGMNDNDVINCFGFYDYLDYEIDGDYNSSTTDSLKLRIRYSFQTKVGVNNPALNNEVTGKLYLQKSETQENKLLVNLKITPNTSNSVIWKATEVNGDLTTQEISFSGQQDKTRIIYENTYYITGADLVSFVKDAYKTTSKGNLKMEWANTTIKSNYGWNKSIGKTNF